MVGCGSGALMPPGGAATVPVMPVGSPVIDTATMPLKPLLPLAVSANEIQPRTGTSRCWPRCGPPTPS
jgi:hypothetical protein